MAQQQQQHSDASQAHGGGFSPFVAVAFTVNYVMGTGFLTLPSAFFEAGVVLSLITLVFCSIISDVSKDYVLSAMARAEAIKSKERNKKDVEASLLQDADVEVDAGGAGDGGEDVPLMVKSRKFEIVELCTMFLGPKGGSAYAATFAFYMYGCLWAYTSVFGNACASTIPLGTSDDYLVYVAVFGAITVPLTCMEVSANAVLCHRGIAANTNHSLENKSPSRSRSHCAASSSSC